MGKVEAFIERAERLRGDDRLAPLADSLTALLRADASTEDVFEAADHLLEIREVKDLVKLAGEAVNEQVDVRNEILYDLMIEKELPDFGRKGQKFYLTHTNYVQAKPELGGTSNPDLIEWLEGHDLGELAKRNVNANSLRAAVNRWLEDNPIEAVVDGSPLDGQDLLDHLGLTLEEFEQRIEDRDGLHQFVNLTEKPVVGVRKSSR